MEVIASCSSGPHGSCNRRGCCKSANLGPVGGDGGSDCITRCGHPELDSVGSSDIGGGRQDSGDSSSTPGSRRQQENEMLFGVRFAVLAAALALLFHVGLIAVIHSLLAVELALDSGLPVEFVEGLLSKQG